MLRDILAEVDTLSVRGGLDREIAGLALDSRRLQPGEAFFALPGVEADGARFVPAAVSAGATVVFGNGTAGAAMPSGAETTFVEVAEPRLALAQAACRFHGHPSRSLQVVAVTGTNGKTTTTYLLESIALAAGLTAGVIGTTGIRMAGGTRPSTFTTPEAPELQSLLADMLRAGIRCVALEASSHALHQRRTWGLEPDACVFTNLTQDHLDYHLTFERYLDAKLMLFDGRNSDRRRPGAKRCEAVVNADDPLADAVTAAARQGGLRVRRFGSAAAVGERDGIAITHVANSPGGLTLRLEDREGGRMREHAVALPMLGRYNAWNAAAAFGAARALGLDGATAARGLEQSPGVPGRLERVIAGQPFTLVVDYAHTPDALERALAASREHTRGRVLLVFGCGGDRDRGKRPRMGAAAAKGADRAWVTNDNPRREDPREIAAAIVAGAPSAGLVVELDRRAAIGAAIAAAQPDDVVLIAGKGHETTQTIGSDVLPFDDRVVARELLHGLTRAVRGLPGQGVA